MSDQQIILATSANRPEYKRDFLTCLASPDGHRVAFSYRRGWFADSVAGASLAGRAGLIVFCEAEEGAAENDFLAVRHVEIEQTVPADIAGLRASTPVTVVFHLGALVPVTDAELIDLRTRWNAALRGAADRPRPGGDWSEGSRYVFEHPALPQSAAKPDVEARWRLLSEELGEFPSLHDAFFFRVGGLRDLKRVGVTSEQSGSLAHVYPLKPSAEYELPLDAYARSGAQPYSKAIEATSSSEQLAIQAITQSSAGRASQATLVLRAGEVKRAQVATLTIQGAEGFEYAVPRVEIATRVKPNLGLALVLLVLIAVGVVLGGLPKDALGMKDVLLYPVKVAGGLIVAGATLFALGRVPGVGK